jgi:antitoxin component YwqK of YwqJK toxin-antitoxin module
MNFRFISVILFVLVHSCKEKPLIEYHDNGNVSKKYFEKNGSYEGIYKDYYSSGNLMTIKYYAGGIEKDSSLYYYDDLGNNIEHINYYHSSDSIRQVYFYKSGIKKKEGYINEDGIAIGKWQFYDDKQSLAYVKEFKKVNGKEYLNQVWSVNENKDTLYYKSHFFNLYTSRDTLLLNEPFKAIIRVDIPLFKEEKSSVYVLMPKGKKNFNKDFSNERKIELDTFYSLSKDLKNQKWFKDEKEKYPFIVAFGKKDLNLGKNVVRGIIVEHYFNKRDSSEFAHRSYFEKDVYVRDTLESNRSIRKEI